jgi:hypothetical protein
VISRLPGLARGLLHRLLHETRGSIALKFAMVVPAVAMLSVGAVDLMAVTSAQTRLQAVADAGALAAAPALALASDGAAARERAASFVAAELSQWHDAPTVVGTYEIVEQGAQRGIRVLLQANRPSFFANMLPPGGWNFVGDATATSVGLVPLCVLNIATAGDRLLELATRSRIEAPECLVHSNHTITVKDRSEMIGEAIQAVGSASGTIVPRAGTGAARIEDPFANLPLDNPDGVCSNANVDRANKRIRPGLHCAISIGGSDVFTLEPGEHWFTDGAMTVRGTATLKGEDVVLLIGRNGAVNLTGDAKINLTGRRTGPFAGIVIAALPEHDQTILINSSRVERLEGAIYVPNAILEIEGNTDVARQSAWTVIVAASLMLTGSPNVFINADYGASDVPVPSGVGPNAGAASGGGSRLIR